jgi:DNA-binding NarL/FixJ family response regulator
VLRLLARFLPHAEVEQVRDRVALRGALAARAADFLITSEALLDGDALDLLAEARARRQCDRLLVLTHRREPQVIFAIRSLGAHGAVDSRSDGAPGLADAIRRIGCGGAYWSQSFLEILRGEGPNGHVQRVLSPAELYVFAVLGDGSDDQTGADVLGLSLQSVHAYRKRIHQKLRLQHKGQLVSLAIRCGLVRFTERGVERPGIEALRSRSVFRTRRGEPPRCLPGPPVEFEASSFQAVAEPAVAGVSLRGQKRVTMPSK